ncbi:hypothetical protein GALMADRAFT_236354 [Galerina marginata CBS 339.88]|uniref:Peptidase M24 domain-containing protein n=1 Tax=Galerina marginata (strain CBS 339.88) TaxID=685588 RepID=A0A067TKY5_GALM3|nr:hypothetical protein GALMADRAFT_236354 [Galerina marginata CBS 339.88]
MTYSRLVYLLLAALGCISQRIFGFAAAQLHPLEPARYQPLPALRQRALIQNQWIAERITKIPSLLKKYNAQAWLLVQREHAEDTIWWSIKNATDFDAHRRTVLLFHTNESSLAGMPNPLKWIDNTGQVWPELRSTLERSDPDRIVLNTDEDIAFAGGLHVGELAVLQRELGERWMKRTVNEPMLAVEFVATKVPGQLQYYQNMQENVWAMLEEGFSHKVIRPGVTTTEDLSWWFREKMQNINVTTWNQPRISVVTRDKVPGWEGTDGVIQEGHILHIDFGITAMGLNTDTQHMAYVLKTDSASLETDAPCSLQEGLRKSNRMQDIVLGNMWPGLTGNIVLRRSLDQMKSEGIDGQIYCHPIGDWGHDAGSVMGFVNLPEHVPVLGDLPILSNTYYSIELYAYHFVPEQNETIRFLQEENVAWSDESQSWKFVRGRQERFHLVDSTKIPPAFFVDQIQS